MNSSLFLLANSRERRKLATKDEKGEKAMTRGNELVSFLVIATKWTYQVRKEAVEKALGFYVYVVKISFRKSETILPPLVFESLSLLPLSS